MPLFDIPRGGQTPQFNRPTPQQPALGPLGQPSPFGFQRPTFGTGRRKPRGQQISEDVASTQLPTINPIAGGPGAGKVGNQPISQQAYEQQAQTLLQSNLASQQAQAERAFQEQQNVFGQQAAESLANLRFGHESELAKAAREAQAAQAGTSTSNMLDLARLQGEQELAQMGRGAELQEAAETRRLGYLPQIIGQLPAPVSFGQGFGADETAARGAAFARAKEQAGNTALSALRALQDFAAERGQTGSSMERQMIGDVVGGAAGDVNEFTREQLIQDLNRAADIADLQYQGGIAQRGQNLSMLPSLLGLIGSRGLLY